MILVLCDFFKKKISVSCSICPIFQVSNVTGAGLPFLRQFLNILHSNGQHKYNVNAPAEYTITDTFSVPGVGTVVSGTVLSGKQWKLEENGTTTSTLKKCGFASYTIC